MRHRLALAALAGLMALAPAGTAQGDRVNLLSHRDDYGGYNDIWGYHSGGREVAILGIENGVAFYDCTDPSNPQFLTFIGHTNSLWGDIATQGAWCYVVNEGGGGMQIISMQDIDNIFLATTYNGISTAHNVSIDTATQTCYLPGANTGMPILDISNRQNPSLITTYTDNYVHDVTIQDGMAHLAEIYAGDYRLVDVSNLPALNTLDVIQTPGDFTHNTWPNADNTICVTSDENSTGHLGVYDISNPNNIVKLSEFVGGSIIHNAAILGNTVHCSYYAEGYVAIDISDPANPVKLGSYDTYGGGTGGYDGGWGVYPYSPSGVVYLSDLYTGLYVLALALGVDHNELPNTTNTAGPYTAVATIQSSSLQYADLHYSTDDGQSFQTVSMVPGGGANEWLADIPGQPAGTTVQYYIEASDGSSQGRAPANPGDMAVFNVGERATIYATGFEGISDQGWTHGERATQDDWQRGNPAGKAGDPNSPYAGNSCWANDLGESGWNGFYSDNVDNWLQSAPIDCSNSTGTRLRFERWLTIEDATNDQARIRVNGNTVWENPASGNLLDTGWVTFDIDISQYADGVADTVVRYVMKSDNATNFGGWNIDQFEVYSVADGCPPPTHYGNGFPGTGGIIPTITTSGGDTSIGNTNFTVEGHDMLGGANAFLLVGFDQDAVPYKGITIWVDLTPYLMFNFVADGPNGVAGEGDISFNAGIPNNPNAVGVEVDMQFLVIDPAGPKGWVGTDGLSFTVCD